MEPKNILLVLVVMLIALIAGYISGQKASNTSWEAKWSQRDTADVTARAAQESANRLIEQERQQAIAEVSQNAEHQLRVAQTDAAAAHDAAGRLQQSLDTVQRKLQRSESAYRAGLAGKCEAESRAAVLFAELLSESVERNRQLAATADDARVRGLACEAAYEAVAKR